MEVTCDQAVTEVFAGENNILTTNEVIERIYKKYPEKPWKASTISHNLIGMSVNHSSRRHHTSLWKYELLYSLGNGRFRRYDPAQDGKWEVTYQGVRLLDSEETEVQEELETEALETSLSLESDLEKSLLVNLEQLEQGLQLYRSSNMYGRQLETGKVGRIDILGIDKNKDFVVIELKAGKADDRACSQILRYMGWVMEHLAGNRNVRGIIVANEFSDFLKYAVKAAPNLTLKKYEFHFDFKEV